MFLFELLTALPIILFIYVYFGLFLRDRIHVIKINSNFIFKRRLYIKDVVILILLFINSLHGLYDSLGDVRYGYIYLAILILLIVFIIILSILDKKKQKNFLMYYAKLNIDNVLNQIAERYPEFSYTHSLTSNKIEMLIKSDKNDRIDEIKQLIIASDIGLQLDTGSMRFRYYTYILLDWLILFLLIISVYKYIIL